MATAARDGIGERNRRLLTILIGVMLFLVGLSIIVVLTHG
jgi:hypothetical protein